MIEQVVTYDGFDDGPPPGWGRGQVVLRCDPAAPLVVSMDFGPGCICDISRNLICQGVQYPVGLGDVRFEPYRSRIAVTLSSPAGRSLLLLDRAPVDLFVQKIRDIKDDTPDIDGLIEQIQNWGSR